MQMTSNAEPPFLEMRDITKTFPGVRALDGVTFNLQKGEIHALVGENGAGKSTLMKILGGVYPYPQYGGQILIEGAEQKFASIREAEKAGIAIIFQELSLVKEMSVGENIFLGREPRKFGVIRWEELPARGTLLANMHCNSILNLFAGHGNSRYRNARRFARGQNLVSTNHGGLTDSEVETLFAS